MATKKQLATATRKRTIEAASTPIAPQRAAAAAPAPVAAKPGAEPPIRRMPTLVTIVATSPVHVITESIRDGGRERVPNGEQRLEANQPGDFLVGPLQSVRVVDEK